MYLEERLQSIFLMLWPIRDNGQTFIDFSSSNQSSRILGLPEEMENYKHIRFAHMLLEILF